MDMKGFEVGSYVKKNEDTWVPNAFDEWLFPRGVGIGKIVEPPFRLDDLGGVDVKWPGGKCFEQITGLLPATYEEWLVSERKYNCLNQDVLYYHLLFEPPKKHDVRTLPKWAQEYIVQLLEENRTLRMKYMDQKHAHELLFDHDSWFRIENYGEETYHLYRFFRDKAFPVCDVGPRDSLMIGRKFNKR